MKSPQDRRAPKGMRIRRGAHQDTMTALGLPTDGPLKERWTTLKAAAEVRHMTVCELIVATLPDPYEVQPLVCPRCEGPIPTAEKAGQHPGAMSRITENRDIEICSGCGTAEAFNLVPLDEWPVDLDEEAEIVRLLVDPIHEPSHDERMGDK